MVILVVMISLFLLLQDVSRLIYPNIAANNTQMFLWNHLLKDLDVLAKAIGRSEDDASLLMHMILADILSSINTANRKQQMKLFLFIPDAIWVPMKLFAYFSKHFE